MLPFPGHSADIATIVINIVYPRIASLHRGIVYKIECGSCDKSSWVKQEEHRRGYSTPHCTTSEVAEHASETNHEIDRLVQWTVTNSIKGSI